MNQAEYEAEQERLLHEIGKAQQRLWFAEGSRESMRVRMNREDALRQAQEAYDQFMEKAGSEA